MQIARLTVEVFWGSFFFLFLLLNSQQIPGNLLPLWVFLQLAMCFFRFFEFATTIFSFVH